MRAGVGAGAGAGAGAETGARGAADIGSTVVVRPNRTAPNMRPMDPVSLPKPQRLGGGGGLAGADGAIVGTLGGTLPDGDDARGMVSGDPG